MIRKQTHNTMYLLIRSAAANNDMDSIREIMKDDSYNVDMGKEAIGIAMICNNNNIAYELLSYPGALEEFFNHPFKVDNGLGKLVEIYKRNKQNNKY